MRQCIADAELKASTAQNEQKKIEESTRPLLEQLQAAQAKISGFETEVAGHAKAFSVQKKSLDDVTKKLSEKEMELHDYKQQTASSLAFKEDEIKRLSGSLSILAKVVSALADGTFGECSLLVPAKTCFDVMQ